MRREIKLWRRRESKTLNEERQAVMKKIGYC